MRQFGLRQGALWANALPRLLPPPRPLRQVPDLALHAMNRFVPPALQLVTRGTSRHRAVGGPSRPAGLLGTVLQRTHRFAVTLLILSLLTPLASPAQAQAQAQDTTQTAPTSDQAAADTAAPPSLAAEQ